MKTFKETLRRYVDAGLPIIYVKSTQSVEAEKIIRGILKEKEFILWDAATADEYDGLEKSLWQCILNLVTDGNVVKGKIFLMVNAHAMLQDKKIVMLLKALADKIAGSINGYSDFNVIVLAPVVTIPEESLSFTTVIQLNNPDICHIENIISTFCLEQGSFSPEPSFRKKLAEELYGLSEFKIRLLLALAFTDDGELTLEDIELIRQQRQVLWGSEYAKEN